MKQAIVYDRINKIGGAEKVLETLHQMYPKSPLYTAVYHPQRAGWAKNWDVRPSFINNLPFAKKFHELYPWLTPLAFENSDFKKFSRVITVTSAEAKGIVTRPQTFHLCYCLTPTRYLWGEHDTYKKELPQPLRLVLKPVFSHLRKWDKIASQRPDAMIAISNTVQKRIKLYYERDVDVVYPPVEVELFIRPPKKSIKVHAKNYYLVVSRLVAYKRIELAIKACNKLNRQLVVVGSGVKKRSLAKIAGPTITFIGKLTQDELVVYYQNCRALIIPQEEDFGINIVEAQAAGKPVIAYNKGGATEIINKGKTGIFFAHQSLESLTKAVTNFERMHFKSSECRKNSLRFTKQRFIKEFNKKVEELWLHHQQKNGL